MSRRVAKTVGSTTRTFFYDGWNLVQESAGTSTNAYVWGLDLSGSLQGAGGVGGLLSASLNGTQAFYSYDANGNVSDLVASNGTSLAHYEFDPYGNAAVSTGSLSAVNPFRFSTKYTDDETGLYYYGYRYYSPDLGRWTSRDPIEEEGGLAIYAFCFNNAVRDVDGVGLSITCASDEDIGNKSGIQFTMKIEIGSAVITIKDPLSIIKEAFKEEIIKELKEGGVDYAAYKSQLIAKMKTTYEKAKGFSDQVKSWSKNFKTGLISTMTLVQVIEFDVSYKCCTKCKKKDGSAYSWVDQEVPTGTNDPSKEPGWLLQIHSSSDIDEMVEVIAGLMQEAAEKIKSQCPRNQ
jgi:RHS repeat-associated protein